MAQTEQSWRKYVNSEIVKSAQILLVLIQLLCSQICLGSLLQMKRDLRLGTDRDPKESYKQGVTQHEARGCRLTRLMLAFVK